MNDLIEVTSKPFDYSALPPEAAKVAKDAVGFIGERHRSATDAISEIGDRLIAVKDSLPHGQFSEWLEAEFGWSDKTARNYMAVARNLPKTETISVLPPTTMYKLAHAPEPVRARVIEAMETRHIPAEVVSGLVDEERARDKAAKAEAAKSPEQRAKEKAKDARLKRQREKEREEDERKLRERRAQAIEQEKAVLAAMQLIRDRFGDDLHLLRDALEGTGSELSELRRRLDHPFGQCTRFLVTTDRTRPWYEEHEDEWPQHFY